MRSEPRTSCPTTAAIRNFLSRVRVLDGSVPPGMDLAQANWFYQNTFAAPASVAPEWNGNVAAGNAGSLGAGYLAAIVARVNDYRWMAGLPGGVTLDPTENAEAQQAALMMAANDQLNHSPPSTWLDYTAAGADAAAHSDLDLGVSGVAAIDLYMTDPGSSNTFVGHRRWMSIPPDANDGRRRHPRGIQRALCRSATGRARTFSNRRRLAARWFRAGAARSTAMVASVRRRCRLLESDGRRHRERHTPDRLRSSATMTTAMAAMPSCGTCLSHRRRSRASKPSTRSTSTTC